MGYFINFIYETLSSLRFVFRCRGMAEGFLQAGFDIPFASDRSPQAALTYEYRHREQLGYKLDYFCGDVQELAEEKN